MTFKDTFTLILTFLTMLLLASVAAGCSDNAEEPAAPQPDAVALADGATVTASPEGGEVALRFTANKEWSIEIPEVREHFNGVLELRQGAPGEMCVPFTALPNMTGKTRSTTLRITAGRASAEVRVMQEPVGVELPPEEEVREYLMRLYRETDGPNWRFQGKWGSDLPLNQWGSAVKYENGRLSLILGELNLKGDVDLSGCKALVSIRCSKNQIRRLDVSGCPLLTDVECVNTGLEEVDLTGCLSLAHVNLSYNSLRCLDIGWSKTLLDLDVRECRLEALDLSECVSLQGLTCAINRIRTLEIPHRYRLIDCFCYENEIGRLDLSGSPQLQTLNCGDNELTELNVTDCPRLDWIYCYNNRLTELDISGQRDVLRHLYCFSNRLSKIDVAGFRKLTELHCSDNGLSSLALTGCKTIRWLYCSHNNIESLDFSDLDLDVFERLDCSYNRLQKADIASLRLMRLWCQGNRIGGEIPEHFDRLLEFEHDARYEYRPDTGTFTDRGYGWWYPGEPDKMAHRR